ncbi:MalY/PatB family protein [Mesobacillus zeae]|uniref:cysteine-S-conjugate beta-lyase n=1 Tax=Mesobacillus zeae TaxID=1917180 RepID=A0A398BNA9_9BACI|nr:PatB family C-S lyase [Mesobacillus zeae]RID88843.1 putative C-S lyase [Mesobacillus zeae]
MIKIDFSRVIDRVGSNSVKWEKTKEMFGTNDVLPMWVADMDFLPPDAVTNAIKDRMEHGIYGYTFASPAANEAVQGWLARRHDWNIETSWMLYSPGVVPSISTAIGAFTKPGDKVMVQSPIYPPFMEMTEKNGCTLVNSPLLLKDGRYNIDFSDFEEKLKEGVKLFILCSPHNPGGRVWQRNELERMGELCRQYDCLIISDEIHSDLVFQPNRHIPIASAKEEFKDHVITFVAPSKTFNIAGLQASAVIIPNQQLYEKFQAQQAKQGLFGINAFGITALQAAYQFGDEWLDHLLSYLKNNLNTAIEYIHREIPGVHTEFPDASYLLWIDCRKLGLSDEELRSLLLQKGKLALEPGPKYGPGGEGFVRMNVACPESVLMDGLKRLKTALT